LSLRQIPLLSHINSSHRRRYEELPPEFLLHSSIKETVSSENYHHDDTNIYGTIGWSLPKGVTIKGGYPYDGFDDSPMILYQGEYYYPVAVTGEDTPYPIVYFRCLYAYEFKAGHNAQAFRTKKRTLKRVKDLQDELKSIPLAIASVTAPENDHIMYLLNKSQKAELIAHYKAKQVTIPLEIESLEAGTPSLDQKQLDLFRYHSYLEVPCGKHYWNGNVCEITFKGQHYSGSNDGEFSATVQEYEYRVSPDGTTSHRSVEPLPPRTTEGRLSLSTIGPEDVAKKIGHHFSIVDGFGDAYDEDDIDSDEEDLEWISRVPMPTAPARKSPYYGPPHHKLKDEDEDKHEEMQD
jgi:hypothetical protein